MRKVIKKFKDIEIITKSPGISLLGSPIESCITTEIIKVKGKTISKIRSMHGLEIK